MRRAYHFIFVLFFFFYILNFIGCATVPTKENPLPVYHINGARYLSLASLCELRGIAWEYDSFSRSISLTKPPHKIHLMVGDSIALVDGAVSYLNHPVDMCQGAIVVPYRFKEQIIDTYFKQEFIAKKAALNLSKMRKVVIDAGHGGKDPGAIGVSGLKEKDVTLDIAKRLSAILRENGIEVVMTRSTDKFIPLSGRVDIANRSKADLFLSVHANANRVRSLRGFEIYYVSSGIDDSQRALTAAREDRLSLDSRYFAGSSLELKATLWDMIYTQSRAQSQELAGSICKVINRNLDTPILGIKEAKFQVLKGARMPAILIEMGFLSNSGEEHMLKNEYYRQKIAEGIIGGLDDHCRELAVVEGDFR